MTIPDRRLLFVNFHHVKERASQSLPFLNFTLASSFELQIEQLQKLFDFPDPREFFTEKLPTSSRPVCFLTFDDGLKDHFEFVLPILEKLRIKGIFSINSLQYSTLSLLPVHMNHILTGNVSYVSLKDRICSLAEEMGSINSIEDVDIQKSRAQYRYDDEETGKIKYFLNAILDPALRTRIIERLFSEHLGDPKGHFDNHYLSLAEIGAISNLGHQIGVHGHSHLYFSRLSKSEQAKELKANFDFLSLHGAGKSQDISWFSIPFGGPDSFDSSTIEEAKKIGLRNVLTMKRGFNSFAGIETGIFNRVDTNDVIGGKYPLQWSHFEGY